jgi:hypothetical protein
MSCSLTRATRCLAGLAVLAVATAALADLQPRNIPPKPAKTIVDPVRHDPGVVVVKFNDDFPVDAVKGVVGDKGTGMLAAARDVVDFDALGTWRPMHRLPEAQLDQLRTNAEANLGKEVADLTTVFYIYLAPGLEAGQVCDALNGLDIVDRARPNQLPAPAPGIPDYEDDQQYINPATDGVDAECMWNVPGGTGVNVAVCDIEYSWNLNHIDLPTVTQLSADPTDPFNDNNHGTAVLGEMAGLPNGIGVTGICYGSTFYVAGADHSGTYDLPQGITDALGTLVQGDFILIEQQTRGPNYTGMPPGTQFGLVASEWDEDVYDAIVVAVGNGVCVVAAAGNGSQDLDGAEYNVGHAPFLPANDSGSIIVGAGGPPDFANDRQRLGFSNYGAAVELQGIGQSVITTGYGDLFMGSGVNEWMTGTFSGTSSSSPIVTGAAAVLQSAYFQETGNYLDCITLRDTLVATGSPQLGDTSENIGPRPNAAGAWVFLFPADDCNNNGIPDECDADCDGNGVPDDCDIANGTWPDCQPNGIPDVCDVDPTDPDGNGLVSEDCQPDGIPDECQLADGSSQDCNMNGIPDECDIADGTSLDCQPNGIPDECEIWMGSTAPGGPFFCQMNCNPDCNNNGIPDECDIADGTSQDCNNNGIPDECDTDHQLWSVDEASPTLHLVDYTTGGTIRTLPLTGLAYVGGNGLACDPTTDTFWCILRTSNDCNDRWLGSINMITGAVTTAGNLPDCFDTITFDDAGTLWGVTGDNADVPERLYTISTADASTTFIRTLGHGDTGEAIAWDPYGGILYHASGTGPANFATGTIWETVNGGITPIILDGYDEEVEITGLAYDARSHGFAAATRNGELVHRTEAGYQSEVGAMSHQSGGLVFNKPYSPDCNNNDVPDDCEITSGAAEDCNNNGILDECELEPEFDPAAAQCRDFCQHAEYVCPGITYTGDTFNSESEYLDFPGGTTDSLFECDTRVGLYDCWYKYRPASDGLLFVHVEGPGAGLEWVFGIYEDCPATAEGLLDCNVFQHHGTIVWEVEQGECYWIRIAATYFNRGAFVMDLVGPECVLTENDLNADGELDDCHCPWDVNNSGVVDMTDFLQVVAAIGLPCAGCVEDIDNDGDVDADDAQSVFLNFGDCPENVVCLNPGGCGTHPLCGNPDGGDPCVCFERYDGQGGVCLRDAFCGGLDPCPTGDCPPGTICVVNTCCGGNVCMPLDGCTGNPDGLPAFAPDPSGGWSGGGPSAGGTLD